MAAAVAHPASPPSVVGRRLDSLDALRGLAAVTVLLEHALGQQHLAGYRAFATGTFDLGVFGVTLFFLVSGFIIPVSLERSRGLLAFWVNRVARLYPLLWFSLVLAGTCALLSRYALAPGFGAFGWLANATMLPLALHQEPIGPLWTLQYEMVFYVAISGLLLVRLHRRAELLALAVLGVASFRLLHSYPHTVGDSLGTFWYVFFFVGGVLGRAWSGHLGARRAARSFVALATVSLLVIGLASPHVLVGAGPAHYSARQQVLSRGLALLVFGVVLTRKALTVPGPLAWLGTISYSVYLLHVTVIKAVPAVGGPVITTLVWVVVTVALAGLTYRWVELPGIALGHRISRAVAARRASGGPEPAAVAQPV